MAKVGLLVHSSKRDAREYCAIVVSWLEERGHSAHLLAEDAAALGMERTSTARSDFAGLDLLVVLGGDGTMLHGVKLAGLAGVPILGVNHGKLGFLTEVGPADALPALARALAGDVSTDERTTVQPEIVRRDGTVELLGQGINELSLERSAGGKMIRMSISVAGQPFTKIGADGLICATPTGSTAYAFSMRGPVVAPELRCLVVVAVGAHALFDRPIVVAEGHDVEVAIHFGGKGVVVVDGRPQTELSDGDLLRARVGEARVRLVRLSPDSYFTRVAKKFDLP